MSIPDDSAAAKLEAVGPEGEKNVVLLGRASMTACIIGAAFAAYLLYRYKPTATGMTRAVFAPFIGCEIVAFVTGVFSRNSLLGKMGMMISMLLFALFLYATGSLK